MWNLLPKDKEGFQSQTLQIDNISPNTTSYWSPTKLGCSTKTQAGYWSMPVSILWVVNPGFSTWGCHLNSLLNARKQWESIKVSAETYALRLINKRGLQQLKRRRTEWNICAECYENTLAHAAGLWNSQIYDFFFFLGALGKERVPLWKVW